MKVYSRFKRWLAALMNIVEHEVKQDLQFKAIDEASNKFESESDKFATEQSRRIAALEKRLNAAEALGRFQSVKLHRYEVDLAAALKQLKSATDALADHNNRVHAMEALVLRKTGLLPRRS